MEISIKLNNIRIQLEALDSWIEMHRLLLLFHPFSLPLLSRFFLYSCTCIYLSTCGSTSFRRIALKCSTASLSLDYYLPPIPLCCIPVTQPYSLLRLTMPSSSELPDTTEPKASDFFLHPNSAPLFSFPFQTP
jgi:hypothetical protein